MIPPPDPPAKRLWPAPAAPGAEHASRRGERAEDFHLPVSILGIEPVWIGLAGLVRRRGV